MAEDRVNHPSGAELEQFLLGQLPEAATARVVGHLLMGCGACSRLMKPLASVLLRPNLVDEAAVEVGDEYDFPLFKAIAAARRYAASIRHERLEAQRDLQEVPLREVPAPRPLDPKERGLRDWERCERLLLQARELRRNHPPAAVAATSMAVCLAERIAADLRGPRELADLQARTLAERGNARRVADDLAGAESDLSRALERAGQGTESPAFMAQLLDLTASLRIDQRRIDEASRLLDWVHFIYLELGDRHEAGRALISKSNAASYALDLQKAIRLLTMGLQLIDTQRDPHLVLTGVHNLAYHLIDDNRVDEARRLMQENRPLYAAHGGYVDRLKARWLEGRIAFLQDDAEEAEAAFQEVRAGFEEVGVTYDFALVSLELAEIWLAQGRTAAIFGLLDNTLSVFRSKGIRREAIAALLLLRESLRQERVTVDLIRKTASRLEQLCAEPVRWSS